MKECAIFYGNRHQVGDEIRQQAADELEMPEQFGEIPCFIMQRFSLIPNP